MEEKKEIFRARSKENGIVIYSNKNPLLCYEAYIDEKGEIHTSPIISVMSELKDFSGTLIATDVKRQIKITSYLRIALCILSILSIVITQKITIAIGMMYFAICASREVVNLVTFIYDVKIGSRQALGRFHAAEHQALIAYKRYQRIPTMEEVRKETRFDQDCGSRLIIDKVMGFLLLSILICTCAFIPFYVYFGSVAILIGLLMLERKYNFFRVFQIFLTNKPTDKELEVALAGVEIFEKMEADIQETIAVPGGVIMKIMISLEDDDEHETDT